MTETSNNVTEAAGAKAESLIVTALDAIFEPMNRSDAPGVVVGVAHRGRTIYRRGFGLASIEQATANTPATRMRVASVTKQFTCLAALLLADEHRLDLDAPIKDILPELSGLPEQPTLRQFMNHTSGLRDVGDLAFLASGVVPIPPGSILSVSRRQTETNFPPGSSQLYCNTGYELLSLAIERASGMAFEQVLKTRIFEPLGMIHSISLPSDMQIVPGLAAMHMPLPDGTWRRGMTPTEELKGSGAMVTTVDDMLRWMAQLRGPREIGSESVWQQLLQPAVLSNGYRTDYACGLIRARYRGLEVLHHGGSLIGVGSQMITVPGQDLDVMVMTNSGAIDPVGTAHKVIDAVLGDAILGPRTDAVGIQRFRHLAGATYHSASGNVFGFDDVDGKLGISIWESPPVAMLREEDGELRIGGSGMGPIRLKLEELLAADTSRAPDSLNIGEAGTFLRYDRLPSEAPSAREAGASLVGRYRVPDLDADATVEFEGDVLTLRIETRQGVRTSTLEPRTADVFLVLMRDELFPGRNSMTVERSGSRADTLLLNGGRSRHIRFVRTGD